MFSSRKRTASARSGKKDQRAYAVGDIHGCLSETKDLLERIRIHNAYRASAETYVIFLGDLVDRGPDSQGVVELLMEFPYDFAKPLFVMGNHEEMMVRSLGGETHLLPDWLEFGGYACAESYGVPKSHLVGQEPAVIEHVLRSAIPRKHVAFLRDFLDYVVFGDFVFTHAGVRPGVALEDQDSRELRWIREPFLSSDGDFGMTVVHGHTISDRVEVKSNRIGLDTGAYKTGKLSAICIDEDDVSFIATS